MLGGVSVLAERFGVRSKSYSETRITRESTLNIGLTAVVFLFSIISLL